MVSNLTLPVHQPGAVAVTHGCESGVAQMQSCMADDVVYKSLSLNFKGLLVSVCQVSSQFLLV